MKTAKRTLILGCAIILSAILGIPALQAGVENHTFQLPSGTVYFFSFPIEVKTPGVLTANITCENEINMPEGRELKANPLFVIIYKKDHNKQLHNMAYKYFMNSLTLQHNVSAEELNLSTDYIVTVRNNNARVKADCALRISYPTPMKKLQRPKIPLQAPKKLR